MNIQKRIDKLKREYSNLPSRDYARCLFISDGDYSRLVESCGTVTDFYANLKIIRVPNITLAIGDYYCGSKCE